MWLVFVVTVVIVTATISTSFAVIVVVVISTIVTFVAVAVAVTGSVVDEAVVNKIETDFWSGYFLFMYFLSLEHQLNFFMRKASLRQTCRRFGTATFPTSKSSL